MSQAQLPKPRTQSLDLELLAEKVYRLLLEDARLSQRRGLKSASSGLLRRK